MYVRLPSCPTFCLGPSPSDPGFVRNLALAAFWSVAGELYGSEAAVAALQERQEGVREWCKGLPGANAGRRRSKKIEPRVVQGELERAKCRPRGAEQVEISS